MKTLQELEAMSNDELRVMLAELDGFTYIWQDYEDRYGGRKDGKHISVPNYPADLNACHEVEMKLTDDQGNTYINVIADSIDPMGEMVWGLDLAVCRATARQRTIALILTLQQP